MALLSSAALADNVTFLRIDKSVINQRLEQPPSTPAARTQALRTMFEHAGCPKGNLEVQAVPDQPLPNIICTLPGTEFGAILITARLDYDGRGEEAPVGWGSVAMLPLLTESLNSTTHRHTLIFAAFSGANNEGASWFWKNLNDSQKREFRGVVELDHIGRTPAAFSTNSNGAVMARILPASARALQYPDEPKPVEVVPQGNADFFERAHIPAITVFSPGYVTTAAEQPSAAKAESVMPGTGHVVDSSTPRSFTLKIALDPSVYNQTYNLLCVYVLFLDRGLGASKRPRTETQVAKAEPSAKPQEAAPTPPAIASAPPSVTEASASTPVATASAPPSPGAPPAPVSSAPAPATTIRVNTRLVQFDVVVTDHQGRPVKDLSASDFMVLQDGQLQKVTAFEFHTPAAVAAGQNGLPATQPASSAPNNNLYTNIPAKVPHSSWTVVLFDILNTGVSDQAYARNQLLQLLKSIPRGQPVALFVLTQRLEMLQGFTQDPDQLLQRAELLDPSKSQILTTMVERERTVASIVNTAQQAAPGMGGATPGGTVDTSSMSYSQAARIAQAYNDHEAFRTNDRVLFTLEAMRGLARAVSGYPGRKNLVWLSGSFPVQIEPDPASTDPFRNSRGFEAQIRDTSSLLATARVAVYPVDVRGLQSKGTVIAVATAQSQVMSDVSPGAAQSVISSSPSNLGTTITAQSVSLADDRATMKNLAQQTGGEAFVNTNDLKRVINRSVEDGSTYYTLAYTPPKDDAGGYHRVSVQVPNKSWKLAYRRGYYSIPQGSPSGPTGTAALRTALQPGMPPATSLLFTASIEPPDAKRKEVKINYVIDSNGVDFADAPDNKKRAQVDCMIIAFDSSGKEVARASDTLDATVPLNAYAAIQQYGLPAHQLISLPPGRYNLRIGVMDRTTQQLGTVDVPLEVPPTAVAQR